MATDKTSANQPVARALLGGLAIVLVIVGQFVLTLDPQLLWPGLLIAGLGLALFLWSRLQAPPVWLAGRVATRFKVQDLWVLAAAALSLLATGLSLAFQQYDQTNYLPVLIVWFGAGATYLAAFLPPLPRPDLRAWWRHYRTEAISLGAVLLIGGVLRIYWLGRFPRVINGDEGRLGQAALDTVRHPLANPFALFENFGSLYLQVIHLSLQVFGHNGFALRLAAAIGGTLAIAALYLLARYLFGRRVALLAAGLLAVNHAHIHFSRTVAVAYIQETLFIPLELYFFISGLEKRSRARLALGGLLLGLNFSIYVSAQIITVYLLVYLVVAFFVCRPLIQRAGRQVLVFWGGLLVAVLPEAVYAWRNPEQFLARLNLDGTFQSGWLTQQVAATGQSPVLILLERVAHAFLSLIYYPAIDFYGGYIPLLDVLTAVLFLLGVVYALWRWRNQRFLLLNGYFWAITVAVGVFAVPPSADSYRMLVAMPAAMLLAALGFEQMLTVLSLADLPRRLPRAALALSLVGAIGAINYRAYFNDFSYHCRYGGDQQTRFASYLGRYLSTVDRESEVFLLGDDVFRYGTHSSVDFLSDNLPVTNVFDAADTLPADPNAVIISIAARAEELETWARAHPGGSLERQYDCDNLMLVAYVLPVR